MFNFGDNVDRVAVDKVERATVDFRQTGNKSATQLTVDFVASVYRA